ncbi:hypothetical protein B0H16DRAFT_1884069 [Mycena metata]|uniref:F-box domain-containing protein n=1 Tax=Mycena metata TaxID=1033252 RepID=A0AAD7JDK5_9AGAR|nr:hypothetical protein B0H16DRAFT_1884069 [Mycena metata]
MSEPRGTVVPELPPEITDSIIQLLAQDFPTLRSCSQVCRAWLPASRHILQPTLKLGRDQTLGFLDIIVSPENTYFAMLPAIELLACENGPTTALLKLLPEFRCLTSLRVCYSAVHYELPVLSSITTLELKVTVFESFTVFANFLGQIPNLKHLKLDEVVWRPSQILSTSRPRLELDTLHVEGVEDRAFPPLKCRRLLPRRSCWSSRGTRVHLGARLKRLHLKFSELAQLDQLNLGANPALQSIRISSSNTDVFFARYWPAYLSRNLPALLQRFHSNDIHELIVDMAVIPSDHGIDLERLSAVLTSVPFSRLRRLQFNVQHLRLNGMWDEVFTENVLKKLRVPSYFSIVIADSSKE